ncbi:hypothetical protein BLSTO_04496 [Blastocystis sp. subtype 1]
MATTTRTPTLRSPFFYQRESLRSETSQSSAIKHDVTFTSQGTIARYSYFPILLRRWSGPFSIALCLKPEEVDDFERQLEASQFDSRLSIVRYIPENNLTYPINKLRNLAIGNVKTDHFWLTDLDMWPSDRLYNVLLSLPESVLNNDHLAVIVPAFEIYAGKCDSFANCSRIVDRMFPGKKDQLLHCIRYRKCNRFRPWDGLHDYHSSRWMMKSYTQDLTNVVCFKGSTQEPYVMVKKTPSLPPFDERFLNYGYNKVQWLEHLRYRGYAFSVLTHGFAVDVPHPFSTLRKQFMETRVKQNKTLNLDLYNAFREELSRNEVDKSVVKICVPKKVAVARPFLQHAIASSDLTCQPSEVYVKFTKKSMSSYASEESFKVYSGNELLMTSPTFANNELRDIEYCLPATQNNQYTIQLLDSGKDSWQSGSWVRIAGVYGNTVFRNLMSDANKEDYSFSLYYAIAKNQQWKAFSSITTIDTAWMSPSFSDGEWQDATLGSFETSLTGTQYFRKHFTSIADMAAYELQMNYRYGIIAYLNGKEIFRDHMPAGAVTPATLSDGAFPSTAFYGVIRPASEMVVGDNVLAVELHFPAVVSTFVDFEAFLALLAPSVPADPCFIYGDEVSLSAEVGSNVENIFDFARNNYYTVPFGQFPSAVTYAFRGSQPFVNGIRIFPYTGYAASPGSFAWEGKRDLASTEWTPILTATGVTYTSSTYRSFFSYLAAGLYRTYRFDIRAAAATSYGRAYEVQPLVCSFSAPSSIEFEQPAYSFFADYDEVTVRPKVIEFTNCTVMPALPAGLTLDATTCVISGKSAVASSGTYEVTSETYGQTYRGSFALELVACNGMLASVVRTYKSDAYLESFTITDASSQQVVLSVVENAGQVSYQEWSAVVCLTGAKYTVAVSTSTNYWESMSFLYVRAVLSGDAYETVLRAHYDANLGIPAVRSFYGQWAVAPKGSWEYRMGEVPAGWQTASGWETASMGSYPASTNTIQLYKKTFTVDSVENVSGVVISLRYLYGCVVYLNGHEAFRNGVTGDLTASSVGLNAYTDLLYRQISLPVKTMVFDDTPAVNYVQQDHHPDRLRVRLRGAADGRGGVVAPV